MTDYNEILCEAIDTIVAQRLSEIKFDETIVATIIENNKKDFGIYTVQHGSLVFESYSENHSYTKGTQVYVLIPKGDYTSQKIILCKYHKV